MAGYKPFSEAKAAFVRVLCFSGLVAIVVASWCILLIAALVSLVILSAKNNAKKVPKNSPVQCSTAIPFVFREHTKPNVDDWGKVAVVVMSLMLMASLWYEWNGGW